DGSPPQLILVSREARNLSWQWEKKFISNPLIPSSSSSDNNKSKRKSAVAAKRIQACLNPFDDPILKDALKVFDIYPL
ncbi:hypothetical protein BHE74_00051967, partial [Ensete ventricosum]